MMKLFRKITSIEQPDGIAVQFIPTYGCICNDLDAAVCGRVTSPALLAMINDSNPLA